VLLEAVGSGTKTDWPAYQARVSEASGDTDGLEQERLLASCQDVCDLNCGLSKEYLQDQGLVSLRTLWIGIHYPAKAR